MSLHSRETFNRQILKSTYLFFSDFPILLTPTKYCTHHTPCYLYILPIITNMNDAPDTITNCANCGKGEESSGDDLKACAACKLVKYCNRECQIAHRPLHKKACKKRAAELHDEALFKEHPPREDCPICLVPLPLDGSEIEFKSCCGKVICDGCIYAMMEARGRGKISLCAFCRTSNHTTDEEGVRRIKKLVEVWHPTYLQDIMLGELRGCRTTTKRLTSCILNQGSLDVLRHITTWAFHYDNGRGVEVDKKKAKHYYELAAMNGNVKARHNLGCDEVDAVNYHRAIKHFLLSARAGDKESLDQVKEGFMDGIVTKDEYANTLRVHQKIQDEMKSNARDKARANQFSDCLDRVSLFYTRLPNCGTESLV